MQEKKILRCGLNIVDLMHLYKICVGAAISRPFMISSPRAIYIGLRAIINRPYAVQKLNIHIKGQTQGLPLPFYKILPSRRMKRQYLCSMSIFQRTKFQLVLFLASRFLHLSGH
jgi:hypothetical protein